MLKFFYKTKLFVQLSFICLKHLDDQTDQDPMTCFIFHHERSLEHGDDPVDSAGLVVGQLALHARLVGQVTRHSRREVSDLKAETDHIYPPAPVLQSL